MEEKPITFATAKLAKEKGFDEITDIFFNSYYPDGVANINGLRHSDGDNSGFTSLPSQSQLQKWLREEYGLQVIALSETYNKDKHWIDYYWRIISLFKDAQSDPRDKEFDNYEQALEAGLQEALKLVEILKQANLKHKIDCHGKHFPLKEEYNQRVQISMNPEDNEITYCIGDDEAEFTIVKCMNINCGNTECSFNWLMNKGLEHEDCVQCRHHKTKQCENVTCNVKTT